MIIQILIIFALVSFVTSQELNVEEFAHKAYLDIHQSFQIQRNLNKTHIVLEVLNYFNLILTGSTACEIAVTLNCRSRQKWLVERRKESSVSPQIFIYFFFLILTQSYLNLNA